MKTLIITFAILANFGFSSLHAATTTLITTSTNKDGTTKEYRLQENLVNYKGAAVSTSTTSKVTTSNLPSTSTVNHETIPVNVYLQARPVTTTTTTLSGSGHTAEILDGYVGTGIPATSTFVRPVGELPVLPDRFGFETVGYGSNGVPNCGCVTRGSCIGQVGAYTSQVLRYSDIVCGHQFETCCFDGPWPGTYDIFASAAACIPREECRRPYGVLPTDVRDFGAIAPCPGLGAVRCILVDNAGFLEFQAALSAIEAANNRNIQHTEVTNFHYEPIHFEVPIVTGSGVTGGSTTSVETTSTVDVESTKDTEPAKVVPAQPPVVLQHAEPCPPEKEHPKTVVVVVSSPKVPQPSAPVEPVKTPEVAVVPTPEVVPEPVVPAVTTPYYGYGGYRGAYGAYPSIIGAYPGFGYGAGFGFRKRIHISKGIGYGFGGW